MQVNLSALETEQRNKNSENIDTMETEDILRVINREDKKVAGVVEGVIPQITKVVDEACRRIQRGGRIFYIGAGTS
ncbi:MAG TPA: N-acetylmuramic acid 6-phosphate etherase, partial [Ruminococcaceae bacterium]|nr:N-acetylmuramic acid 6-phosphate etherase [Oscillospiraceae bacterium]